MAPEAELLHGSPQQAAMRRDVRVVAAEAIALGDRSMDTFLAEPVLMAFITEPGAPVLCLAEAVIGLVVAVGELVTRSATVPLQGFVDAGAADFAPVAEMARLTAEEVDRAGSSGKNAAVAE
jgi:hypothetical protein